MKVVLAEKPSVAVDIAKVVGATRRKKGYIEGNGYRITWTIGHLVDWADPGTMNAAWKPWNADALPMLPQKWPLEPRKGVAEQLAVVKRLLTSKETSMVIAATDAGREGELIWRLVAEFCGCTKRTKRLWISSLTPEAVRKGIAELRPAKEYDGLAEAARARAQADWLVGFNLTRAYTLAQPNNGERSVLSVGRVQTPTLAMVVARDLHIEKFVAAPYLEVVGTFETSAGTFQATYHRRACDEWTAHETRDTPRLPVDAADEQSDAQTILVRLKEGSAVIGRCERTTKAARPPELFDLTELQREANRLWGFKASDTLATAQSLYEKHKLLSYPRSDSRHLPKDVGKSLSAVVQALRPHYELPQAFGTDQLGGRWVADSKVTDHHAIIPTDRVANRSALSESEWIIYDLVCRRLLCAWMDDHIVAITRVEVHVGADGDTRVDRYVANGAVVEQEGWHSLAPKRPGAKSRPELPAALQLKMAARCVDGQTLEKETRPPSRFTEATLLTAMESAGSSLDDRELSAALRERGLGTPATRAAIVDGLIHRQFIQRQQKALVSTPAGRGLVSQVHKEVRSPRLTGEWERRLKRMEAGKDKAEEFLRDVSQYVTEAVEQALQKTS